MQDGNLGRQLLRLSGGGAELVHALTQSLHLFYGSFSSCDLGAQRGLLLFSCLGPQQALQQSAAGQARMQDGGCTPGTPDEPQARSMT